MTTAEAIAENVRSMPEDAQREILDFIEFLRERRFRPGPSEESSAWRAFSLDRAMRGMEEEPAPYTTADIREKASLPR